MYEASAYLALGLVAQGNTPNEVMSDAAYELPRSTDTQCL